MSAMRLSKTRPVGFYRRLTTVKSQCHDALRKLRDVVPAPGTSGDGLVTGMEANP